VTAWWGLVAVAFPGSIAAIGLGSTDLYALGFIALGITFWDRRPWMAAVAFTLAALSREGALIAVAAVAANDLPLKRRAAWRIVLPLTVWFGWVSWVAVRIGAWPWEATSIGWLDRFGFGLTSVRTFRANLLPLMLAIVIVIVALARAPRDSLTWVSVANFAFLVAAGGSGVWLRWDSFTRVGLTAYMTGILAVASARHASHAGLERKALSEITVA